VVKKRIIWWLVMGSFAANLAAAVSVRQLRCENLDDPQGMEETKPRLSWVIDSDCRGETQTGYQVRVASSAEGLAGGVGDLWDSGLVPSADSAQVEYAGQALRSRARCYWQVRVWDHAGKPSSWSPPAAWSMGLLAPADWTALWISDPILAAPANRPLTPIHCYRSELSSQPENPKWIILDLGAVKPLDCVDILPARPEGQNADFRTAMFPLRFKVETAAQADFSDAQLVVDNTAADFPPPRANSCRFQFGPVTARYVRLTVTRLACWDGRDYALALGGLAVFNGSQPIGVGAHVECSDSIESDRWSKRFLVAGKAELALADDAPALATDTPDVPEKFTVSRVPLLRREFTLAANVRRATLAVTARGFYEVRINGKRVGSERLAPGCTDYGVRLQYQMHDVTKLLHRGTNAMGALLGYGWYAGHMNLADNRCMYGYFPQFLAQLEVELADGTHTSLGTDGQWRSHLDGPVCWSDLLDGEGYDCRRETPGWDQPGFDDRAWLAAWSQPRDRTPLVWQRSQPVREVGELRPVAVKEVKPGTYVFDFGQEIAGWCRLVADGPAGTHLRVRHAEVVAPDGQIDVHNLWGTAQQEDYFLDGHGPRILEPHFTYHGFRYAELAGLRGRPKADTLSAVNLRTAATVAGHFECSNTLYNRIQTAAFWTQANLLFDVPAGCAARSERVAWTGDIRPCVQALLFNFDAAPLLIKYAGDLRDDQLADGRFTDICPHAHLRGTTICVGSPGWADAGVSLPWETYVNTGNRRLLADHYDAAKRWVDAIHASNPDLLWRENRGMDWGDWMSAGAATPKEIGATAFFAHSADLLSRMAQALGRNADADRYRTLFQGIRRAFVQNYVATNGLLGGAQGSYALALQFGLLDEPLRSQAASRLDELVIHNGHHPTTGFWSSVELLLALSASGYPDEAARLMDQHTLPSWGYMADHGTTLWEAFNANTQNLSLNHWTHSAVSEWLWRDVAGLNPDEQGPGYRSFTIHPRPTSEVSWCQASFDSPRGRIIIHWKAKDDEFELKTTIPANTTATVVVPASDPGTVTESGKPAAQAEGITLLRTERGAVIYQVGSGVYKFRSRIRWN